MSQQDITVFAQTTFRNAQQVFGIKRDDRRRHVYVVGKTGMGKTTLLEQFVVQDILNGHGVAYIDPHGDTAEKLLTMIPPSRVQDVIYFNPADTAYPIAFNVLEHVDTSHRHLVVSGVVGVFKKLWADSWGPRLEYILRNTILALLETPETTLLGVMRMLTDKTYRRRILTNVKDPVVQAFWRDEFAKWQGGALQEVVAPIQNKVGQFLTNPLMRNIVGQPHSAFTMRDVMDSEKILIVNLAKGRIGEDNSALLGALLVTKLQLAAMSRVDMPEAARRDFYLYVDEFQNFATESFADILSEARKYRLNLTLAHQYIAQLEEGVRNAVFGNVGTIISFRVGAADAEYLEKEFEPIFTANDIVNLPKYHIYLKLMIDGVAADAFSATTLPPIETRVAQHDAQAVITASRTRYATARDVVEERIAIWSGQKRHTQSVTPKASGSAGATKDKTPEQPAQTSGVATQEEGASLPDVQTSARDAAAQYAATREPQEQATREREAVQGDGAPQKDVVSEVAEERSTAPQSDMPPIDTRPMFDAQCAMCDIAIQVPFKPDGKRPVFCKPCLNKYRSAMAKAKNTPDTVIAKVERKVRAPQSKTLSLSQTTYMAPRPFTKSSH